MLRRKNQLSVDDPTRAARYWCSCVCVGLCKRTYVARHLFLEGTLFLTWDSKVCMCVFR